MEDYMTLQQVADQTGIPLRTIQYHVSKGHLKVESPSPRIKLTTQEWVNAWLANPKFHRKTKNT